MSAIQTAKEIRKSIINMAHRSKSAHVGSSLSCVDILTVLYFNILKLDPWQDRDYFVLSKAHAAMALYSTLAQRGIIPRESLDEYCQNGGALPAHLDRSTVRGVEVSAGALGHGFNVALGLALGLSRKHDKRRVFALIGDGESQEGSIWEGALFASKLGLSNFTAVMDYNNLQGYGRPVEICSFQPLRAKWESFGWRVHEVDGHHHESLAAALMPDQASDTRPSIVIARTTKGKGVSFMEDLLVWHYYVVSDQHKERALAELQ